jgi:Regulator of chromosome condensation (RCC1) repeat/IPT/TIG domain
MYLLAQHRSGGLHHGRLTLILAAIVAALTMAPVAPASATSFGAMAWPIELNGSLPVPVSGLTAVTAISAGVFGGSTVALLNNGTVVELGASSNVPVPVSGLSEVTAVSTGADFNLALLRNGTVMAWGENPYGQLGDGGTEDSAVPVPVTGISGATAISAGYLGGMALLADGTVVAWGDNENGELGRGSFTGPETCGESACSTTPVPVTGLSGVTAVDAGAYHRLALLGDGTVRAWGWNEAGQLGDGEGGLPYASKDEPVPVAGLVEAVAISAGEEHSLALLADGTVRAWGQNDYGQLGTGSNMYDHERGFNYPVGVSGLGEVTAISAGSVTSMALLQNGTVMDWGLNRGGELGIGIGPGPEEFGSGPEYCEFRGWGHGEGPSCSNFPVQVSELSGVAGISTGEASFAYGPLSPRVTRVSPAVGAGGGGTSVTVTGTNFSEATAVSFGASEATSFTVNSPTSITAITPTGTGAVDVTVTTPEGPTPVTPRDRFDYAPSVTTVAPGEGMTAGGAAVTITGTNFAEVSAVKFDAADAASFTVNSATSITATAPPGTGTVDVTVTTAGGTSATGSADRFTYVPNPPPTVVTNEATSLTTASATLNATVNPNGRTVSECRFQYGTSPAYGASVPCTSLPGSGEGPVAVAAPVGSLSAKTTYHFRIVATTVIGTSYGSDRAFTTMPEPEFGRCLKVAKGTGQYENAGCTKRGGAKSYEWYPGVVEAGFKTTIKPTTKATLETVKKVKLTCTGETSTGSITGAKAVGNVVVKFTGCVSGTKKCTTVGLAEGELETKTLEGVLGIERITVKEGKETRHVALDLYPVGKTGAFLEYTCTGSAPATLSGSILAPVTTDKMLTTATLKFTATAGKQKPEAFLGGEKDVLTNTLNEQVGLTVGSTQTNEEAVEVNAWF